MYKLVTCISEMYYFRNVVLQHPIALHSSDYAFYFYAVYVQRWLLFTPSFFYTDTTCFDLTGHLP
jgi:hypothetical protein